MTLLLESWPRGSEDGIDQVPQYSGGVTCLTLLV